MAYGALFLKPYLGPSSSVPGAGAGAYAPVRPCAWAHMRSLVRVTLQKAKAHQGSLSPRAYLGFIFPYLFFTVNSPIFL